MSLKLYMDVHVPFAITDGLRRRGIEVISSQEDLTADWSDSELLDRATALGCVLFSMDSDLPREAAIRQQRNETFGGMVFAEQLRISIGQCIADLELIAKVYATADIASRVEYLPL